MIESQRAVAAAGSVGSSSSPAVFEPASAALQFELLYQIGQELNSSLDIHEVMQRVLALATSYLGADRGSIFLMDRQGQVSHHILVRRDLPSIVANRVVKRVLEDGLAGWVIREQQGTVVQDVRHDPRWLVLPDDEIKPESVVAAPITKDTQVLGLITLHRSEAGFFSESHLVLLTAIANQSAIALDNAWLYAEQERIVQERTLAVVETTNFLRNVLDSALDYAILAVDLQGTFLTWNEGARRMFGYSADEVVGKATADILYGPQFLASSSRRNLLQAILDAQEDSPHVNLLHFVRRNGETFPVDVTTTHIRDITGQSVGVLGIVHDATERVRLEQAKTQFIANVSHELRTPIAVLKLQLGNLIRHYQRLDDQTRQELLVEANQQASYLQQLVEDILDLSQIDAGTLTIQYELFDLSQALRRLLGELEHTEAAQKVQLSWQGLDEPSPVTGDPNRIIQAVRHLLRNAFKFSERQARVNLSLSQHDGTVQVTVTDSGPEIPANEHQRIFERFYRGTTATPEKRGPGLGLAIAKQIVEAHGGSIRVESQVGIGNTFTITLPRGPAIS
ncbi:MAG: ATP-binding protein [Chloroflexota bacterium]